MRQVARKFEPLTDTGPSTGAIDAFTRFVDGAGPASADEYYLIICTQSEWGDDPAANLRLMKLPEQKNSLVVQVFALKRDMAVL